MNNKGQVLGGGEARRSRRQLLRASGAATVVGASGVVGSQVLAAGKLREVKLAWNANAICLSAAPVAIERGIFEKHGLKVELVNFAGSTDQLLETIATSKADAGLGMVHRWIKPLESGFDVKLVGSSHGGCSRLVGHEAAGVTSQLARHRGPRASAGPSAPGGARIAAGDRKIVAGHGADLLASRYATGRAADAAGGKGLADGAYCEARTSAGMRPVLPVELAPLCNPQHMVDLHLLNAGLLQRFVSPLRSGPYDSNPVGLSKPGQLAFSRWNRTTTAPGAPTFRAAQDCSP
ncbi:ABC transporter substrate-binding protein [Acidovorax sp.]|uniref:ABC transporter substrate-binding protein n=1 Tax=Acidovorax sp. TaxID=1872122 RepID=UPI002ACE4F72|nr:ABC transporter substrate-binding protein [Acidovorax sp.]MDZ7862396.1 ABC transporter substrate-binding protein [Acidovorax sp.]